MGLKKIVHTVNAMPRLKKFKSYLFHDEEFLFIVGLLPILLTVWLFGFLFGIHYISKYSITQWALRGIMAFSFGYLAVSIIKKLIQINKFLFRFSDDIFSRTKKKYFRFHSKKELIKKLNRHSVFIVEDVEFLGVENLPNFYQVYLFNAPHARFKIGSCLGKPNE